MSKPASPVKFRKALAAIEQCGWTISRQRIARTGTAYIRIARGGEELLVRVGNHPPYSVHPRMLPVGGFGVGMRVLREILNHADPASRVSALSAHLESLRKQLKRRART